MELNDIPNFLISASDANAEVNETSYVSDPATEKSFLYFNESGKKVEQAFSVQEKFERVTAGVWMMPDTKYLRITEGGQHYTVQFSKETLKEALLKYLKNNNANNIRLEHSNENLEGFVAVEHWIVEDENTKSPVYGFSLGDLGYKPNEIPLGTVMKSTYVADEKFWKEQILEGKVKGYSIGGLFNLEQFNKLQEKNKFMADKTKTAELFETLGLAQEKGSIILEDGKVLAIETVITLDGVVITEGEYKMKNGTTLIIKDGSLVDFGVSNETTETEVAVEDSNETVTEEMSGDMVEGESAIVIDETDVSGDTVEISGDTVSNENMDSKETFSSLTKEIGLLRAELNKMKTENANLKEEVAKQPIKTTQNFENKKPVVSNETPKKGIQIRVGSRTVTI